MAGKKTKSNDTKTTANRAGAGANGSSKNISTNSGKGKGKIEKPTSSSSSGYAISAVMAAVAFLAGILTPPTLYAIRQERPTEIIHPSVQIASLPHQTQCTPSNLANYLHSSPVRGLHLVCMEPLNLDNEGKEIPQTTSEESDDQIPQQQRRLEENNSLRLTFYKGAHSGPIRRRAIVTGSSSNKFTLVPSKGVASISWNNVKQKLAKELGLIPEGPTQRPWAIFTATGERIVGAEDEVGPGDVEANKRILHTLASSEMVIIANGGNWIWPGVYEGFRRNVSLSSPNNPEEDKQVTIETLSLQPLVVSITGFLSDEECDHIEEKAKPTMQYSGVSLKDADKGKEASNWRTSQSTFLPSLDDDILVEIERRTASLTRIPRSHQEHVQVLRYGPSEKYDAHHDYFDPEAYQSDPNTLRLIENGRRNRFATVFWYLSDVEEGGETIFPRYGGLPTPRNYADCTVGLKVKPQRGKVIIFYSLDAAGQMDPLSLHGACPVGEGNVKWAANKWVWNAPMGFVSDE